MDIILSSEGIFNGERLIGPISWPHFDLLFIHQGQVEVTIAESEITGLPTGPAPRETTITLNDGQGVLIYPNTLFSGHSTIGSSTGSAHHFRLKKERYSEAALEHLNPLIHKQSGYKLLESNGNQNIISGIKGLLSCEQYDDPGVARRIGANMMALVLQLFDHEKHRNIHLKSPQPPEEKIAELLAENLGVNFMIEELASLVNFSSSHVHRLFSKRYDDGPRSYHNKLKMQKACELLQDQTIPIKSVALQVGFIELSSFYRVFRKYAGLTPSGYRRQYCENSTVATARDDSGDSLPTT